LFFFWQPAAEADGCLLPGGGGSGCWVNGFAAGAGGEEQYDDSRTSITNASRPSGLFEQLQCFFLIHIVRISLF